jgi:ribosomal protein S18 acetylase RimI-like enzyme
MAADLAQLYAIERRCFAKYHRWTRIELRNELQSGSVWIAEDDICIQGFLIGRCEANDALATVATVDVEPAYRGRGVGSRLLQCAHTAWKRKGIHRVEVQVHVDNPVQTLYFRLGYRVAGIAPDYYQDGAPAVLMTKRLLR